ncbi:MAG: 1-acyl-sn-glycerol-3-phosphate acyltransferase [Myxococcota bacterium]
MAYQRGLAEAHRAFVEQQALVHRQFFETVVQAPLPLAASALAIPSANGVRTEAVAPNGPLEPVAGNGHPWPGVAGNNQASPPLRTSGEHGVFALAASPLPEPMPPATSGSVSGSLPGAFRPRGLSFSRADLEVHAGGEISAIFGELFAQQDRFPVQVRMPEPPLLLADRCTGLEADAGSMKKGVCWTETDVRSDSWYLHDGRMPAGIMIESGQADLLLISYLGADFLNRGERAYRLLGCEMTWLGDLPKVGETLAYEIHVDGHAAQGDVRLFFFHYDCHIRRADGTTRPALRVRGGQAGFFTKDELAESAGILWRPETQEIRADARVDPPQLPTGHTFDRDALEAFAAGEPWRCFGSGFDRTKTHTRTPRIQEGRMLFLDRVGEFDPKGGPWGRGYLRAESDIRADEWFFDGHFKNDPCMPGTLMLEGCVQAMAFYLSALGFTVDKDGWRFQPIVDEQYSLRCRGQVTRESQLLTYEIFVEEVHDGPEPRLYADLLCTVDGLGAFHARRFGLELVPSWPLESLPEHGRRADDPRAATASYKGSAPFRFDYPSLLACAWGKPSTAFGPMYKRFDGVRRTPRLPGPPYHFVSRVTKVDGAMGGLEKARTFEFEYDIPEDAWYFEENGAPVMPFSVLLEAALQPCGWTASYVGSTLTSDSDFLFRNLDGKGAIKAEVFSKSGTLRTVVTIRNISASSGMIIESFDVRCFLGDVEVYELDTVFGFFPPAAFEDQTGLPIGDEDRALFDAPTHRTIDLAEDAPPGLARPFLRMIDRVTHLDLDAGTIRAEKDVDAGEWFFKAHFYQDPVQPGSLGMEAMLQLLQVYMLEAGLDADVPDGRFEAIAVDRPHVWKYRGQVVPENHVITTTMKVAETGRDARGVYAIADASLWVDGKRIYEARGLGMRIVEGRPTEGLDSEKEFSAIEAEGIEVTEEVLDPETDRWLLDHRPTHTLPALPMMSMVDRMVAAVGRATGASVPGLQDLQVHRWVVVDGPTRLRTEVEVTEGKTEVRLLVWRRAKTESLSRFELAASATVGSPEPLGAFPDVVGHTPPSSDVDPYGDDRLFHGPAFQLLTGLTMGAHGSLSRIDAGKGAVPYGAIHQSLFDAATHGIPHDSLNRWDSSADADTVGYPRRLDVRFLAPTPRTGPVEGAVAFAGFDDAERRFPQFRIWLRANGDVFAELRLTEILMPKGPIGRAPAKDRRRFLQGEPAPVSLSSRSNEATILETRDIGLSNWLPGTLERAYGLTGPAKDQAEAIAVKDHVAWKTGVHPRQVEAISVEGEAAAVLQRSPLTRLPLAVRADHARVRVSSAGSPELDMSSVKDYWRAHFNIGPWPVEDIYYALIERFVGGFHLEDPAAMVPLRDRSVLYLANHQVGVESLIFSIVASALMGLPTLTVAKIEHLHSWLGTLIRHCFTWPGVSDPGVITYFDRNDPSSLPRIAKELADHVGTQSMMVHIEGTRSLQCRRPVEKMSGIFCDLAIASKIPIVPVRISGGLPVEPLEVRREFPVGMGRQDYWLGAPILPEELEALPYKARKARVIDGINRLGPMVSEEVPAPADPPFEARVKAHQVRSGVPIGFAGLAVALRERAEQQPLSPAAQRLLADEFEASADAESRWLARMHALLGLA